MKKLTTKEFITKARRAHGNKYGYSQTKYELTHSKVTIRCPIHGIFQQMASDHLYGKGCYECGVDRIKSKQRHDSDKFISGAVDAHGAKYSYENVVYVNAHTHVDVKCPRHGIFSIQPCNHLHGRGCPKCRLSRGEAAIIEFLDNNNIKYIYQKSFDECRNPRSGIKLRFDFYVPSYNMLVEYDGEQHYKLSRFGGYTTTPKELRAIQLRDRMKNDFAVRSGVAMLRIKFSEYKKIESILRHKFLN